MRHIKSTGPIPCPYMVVAERPGIEESRRGVVLCGPSGQELDRFLLNNAGLCRDNVYCTNLVKDYRDGENPEPWEIDRDWPQLVEEVLKVRPSYILAMGLFASRAVLRGSVENLDLDWANGLAWPPEPSKRDFWVMPVIHTAATLHQPKYATECVWGFEQFGKLIRGEEMPTGHLWDCYGAVTAYWEADPSTQFCGNWAVDTEGTVEKPWCASFSNMAGISIVSFNPMWRNGGLMVLHNAMHDLPVLASMGIVPQRFTDTMLMANLLCVEPLGLKPLARRWCGMGMKEYSEITADARREKALEYLGRVLEHCTKRSGKA